MNRPPRYWMLWLCLFVAQLTASAISTDSIRQLIPSLEGQKKVSALIDLYLAYYAKGEIDSTLLALDELVDFQHSLGKVEEEGRPAGTALPS